MLPGREAIRQTKRVFVRLDLNAAEGTALFFRFDDASSLAVEIQQIVGEAMTGFQGELPDGHPAGRVDVGICCISDPPASLFEECVDFDPSFLFGSHCDPRPFPLIAR